jgi:hypothetical protein
MLGSMPYSFFILMHSSSVRSLVLPPAPHVTSAYRGSAAVAAGAGGAVGSGVGGEVGGG